MRQNCANCAWLHRVVPATCLWTLTTADGRHEVLGMPLCNDCKWEQQVRDRRETNKGRSSAVDQADVLPTLPHGPFDLIYADPPWRFNVWSHSQRASANRNADNHYPCMETSEIAALPIRALAASDSLLLLWATMPKLRSAFVVMEAWGFLVYDYLNRLFGRDIRRLELFARQAWPGWTSWGFDVPAMAPLPLPFDEGGDQMRPTVVPPPGISALTDAPIGKALSPS